MSSLGLKRAKILFFIAGCAPSMADFKEANELTAEVVFRNASAVPSEPHALETCDGVAGCVPEIYAAAFPDADEAIAKKKAELAELSAKVGDNSAPQRKSQKELKKEAGKNGTAEGGKPQGWNPNPGSSAT